MEQIPKGFRMLSPAFHAGLSHNKINIRQKLFQNSFYHKVTQSYFVVIEYFADLCGFHQRLSAG
jgi:hypothetical protein